MASECGSVKQVIKQWVLGVIVLLLLVGVANLIAYFIDLPFNVVAVDFVNRNLRDLLLISVLFLLARVYADTVAPMDLMAPVFAAVGSMFLTALTFRFMRLIEIILGVELIFRRINPIPIYTLVFLLALVAGVLITLSRRVRGEGEAVDNPPQV